MTPPPIEPRRIIAIGDIHGCSKALETLIDIIGPMPEDLLVPMGDYVDRGPDSRGVLDMLLQLEGRCQLAPLLGNHELMMLEALKDATPFNAGIRFWLECGGMDTIDSYGGHPDQIPEAHLEFLHRCWRFVETERHAFLHANYDPFMPFESQPENLLFWEHVSTTMPGPHQSGKTVIVGHTPQSSGEVLDAEHLICVDTHCYGAGWLTALNVLNGQVWQANKEGELREGELRE